jgi:hypothetical protein
MRLAQFIGLPPPSLLRCADHKANSSRLYSERGLTRLEETSRSPSACCVGDGVLSEDCSTCLGRITVAPYGPKARATTFGAAILQRPVMMS